MIISASLKFGFAEGELVVILFLPSEPICLRGFFEMFQMVDEVKRGVIQCPFAIKVKLKGFTFFSLFWDKRNKVTHGKNKF